MCGVSCGVFFFFQAEDGIRDLVRSRGLGDVYKRQVYVDKVSSTGSLAVYMRVGHSDQWTEGGERL